MKAEVYKGRDGRWYWRMRAHNGRIVADGAEPYTRAYDCRKAVSNIVAALSLEGAQVVTIKPVKKKIRK